MPDLARLLDRIGLAEPPAPDERGFATVHRAYVEAIPYECVAVALGRPGPLALDVIAAHVLENGRGGYCFELNGLLGWLLEELGFRVDRHEARVGPREQDGPTNHLMLVVGLPGDGPERWLADTGLGEGWLDPFPLRAGTHTSAGGLRWTLEREAGGWWVTHHAHGSFPGLRIADASVPFETFVPHHERLSRDPASPFVETFICQRPADDRITTLRARTLTVRGPHIDERRLLADADDLRATLLDRFGITLSDEDTTALWHRISAQHAAWAAS